MGAGFGHVMSTIWPALFRVCNWSFFFFANVRSCGHLLPDSVPVLRIYSGKNSKEVLQNLDNGVESDTGPARLVLVDDDHTMFDELKQQSKKLLEKHKNSKNVYKKNIYFTLQPYKGELAFVFTGSAGAYSRMGHDLLLALPELAAEVISKFGLNKDEKIQPLFGNNENESLKVEDMLWKSSFLSQIHAVFSQKHLGLRPRAAIGFSSGESNALFALGAWQDMGQMYSDFQKKKVYGHEISGDFHVIRKAWKLNKNKPISWSNHGLMAPEDKIKKALATEPFVHLLIINAPGNVIIGGESAACERVIEKIGRHRSYALSYNIANHCPELFEYAEPWLQLHSRKTVFCSTSRVVYRSKPRCTAYSGAPVRIWRTSRTSSCTLKKTPL